LILLPKSEIRAECSGFLSDRRAATLMIGADSVMQI
jgi:hypothetical protein